MSNSTRHIRIRIKAPLQSWGLDACSYRFRGTSPMPTFSGVLGMVCSGLGISYRGQPDKVKDIRDAIEMDVHVVDPGTRLVDFQGAGGGEDKKTEYGKRCVPKDKNNGAGKIYEKEYLQGAHFEVVLRTEDEGLAGRIAVALQNPVWQVFAGRKGCLLSLPPFGGVFSSAAEVKAAWDAEGVKPSKHFVQSPEGLATKDYPACLGDNQTLSRGVKQVEQWP